MFIHRKGRPVLLLLLLMGACTNPYGPGFGFGGVSVNTGGRGGTQVGVALGGFTAGGPAYTAPQAGYPAYGVYPPSAYSYQGPPAGYQPTQTCREGFQLVDGMCAGPVMRVDGPSPYDEHHAHCTEGAHRTIRVPLPGGGYRVVNQTCRPESGPQPRVEKRPDWGA